MNTSSFYEQALTTIRQGANPNVAMRVLVPELRHALDETALVSPLHLAVSKLDSIAVQELLERGATLDPRQEQACNFMAVAARGFPDALSLKLSGMTFSSHDEPDHSIEQATAQLVDMLNLLAAHGVQCTPQALDNHTQVPSTLGMRDPLWALATCKKSHTWPWKYMRSAVFALLDHGAHPQHIFDPVGPRPHWLAKEPQGLLDIERAWAQQERQWLQDNVTSTPVAPLQPRKM